MIVEMRTYDLKPGAIPEYMKLYEAHGLSVQREALGKMIGYFSSEIGQLNQVVHLWCYDDFQDRQRRRDKLMQNETWQKYLALVTPLVVNQVSKILKPASFSPRY